MQQEEDEGIFHKGNIYPTDALLGKIPEIP
jgi:hypothetical protein